MADENRPKRRADSPSRAASLDTASPADLDDDLVDDLVLAPEAAPSQAHAAKMQAAMAQTATIDQACATLRIEVPAEAANSRLDAYLALALSSQAISRARIQDLLAASRITVNSQPARPSLRLRGGEQIQLPAQPARPSIEPRPEPISLTVLHEDAWLAVLVKPAGLMVHAGAAAGEEAASTLVNALLHRFPQLSTLGGPLRPGIVHRLDKETSGLLVIAKTDEAHAALVERFAARQMTKTYIALVEGEVQDDAATIDLPIRRDSVRRTRMTTQSGEGARSAVTHYRVSERMDSRFGRFTLLRLRIETGRTHQIRVHMAAQRHPVVGDTLYGASGSLHAHARTGNVRAPRETIPLDRHFLHAAELAFDHPFTGQPIHLAADLPHDLTALLDHLRSQSPGTPIKNRLP